MKAPGPEHSARVFAHQKRHRCARPLRQITSPVHRRRLLRTTGRTLRGSSLRRGRKTTRSGFLLPLVGRLPFGRRRGRRRLETRAPARSLSERTTPSPPGERLSPNLAWVTAEGFRLGYNYCAPLDWYPRAKACGMNGIISRLEIANDSRGDEALADRFPPGRPAPGALECWRLLRPSSRLAKRNGLHFFFMVNLGASWGNVSEGFRDNPRRFNNGKLFGRCSI